MQAIDELFNANQVLPLAAPSLSPLSHSHSLLKPTRCPLFLPLQVRPFHRTHSSSSPRRHLKPQPTLFHNSDPDPDPNPDPDPDPDPDPSPDPDPDPDPNPNPDPDPDPYPDPDPDPDPHPDPDPNPDPNPDPDPDPFSQVNLQLMAVTPAILSLSLLQWVSRALLAAAMSR